jgi:Secretion system C-terminal sorting domain
LEWEVNSGATPIDQICVEYYNSDGSYGKEPFVIELQNVARCLADDAYSNINNPNFGKMTITKNYLGYSLPSVSGNANYVDVNYEILLKNTGTKTLNSISVEENLLRELGASFVSFTPTLVAWSPLSITTIDYNNNFNGSSNSELIKANSSLPAEGEFRVRLRVTLDRTKMPAYGPLQNQVYGKATDSNNNLVSDFSGLGASDELATGSYAPPMIMGMTNAPIVLESDGAGNNNDINQIISSNCGMSAMMGSPVCSPITWSNDYNPASWISGVCPNTGTITINFTATDACGNTVVIPCKIIIQDTKPPVFDMLPMDKNISCGDPNSIISIQMWINAGGGAWASDPSGPVTITNNYSSNGLAGCQGSTPVTFTYADVCGNSVSKTVKLNIIDDKAPTLIKPAENISQLCADEAKFKEWIINHGYAIAKDECNGVTWTTNPAVPVYSPVKSVPVIFIATDACGNSIQSPAIFTPTLDNEPPKFITPLVDMTIECPFPVAFTPVKAIDNCSVTVTFTDMMLGDTCPASSIRMRTWLATDGSGNTATIKQTILVIGGIPIEMKGEQPDTNYTTCVGDINFIAPTFKSDCPLGTTSVTYEDSEIPGKCPNSFTRVRNWIVKDGCGRTMGHPVYFFVEDKTPPQFEKTMPDKLLSCDANIVFDTPKAIDFCGNTISNEGVKITYEDQNVLGNCSNNYTLSRRWKATDACGNAANLSQTITVEDNIPPVLEKPIYNKEVSCGETPVFDAPVFSEKCGAVNLVIENETVQNPTCTNGLFIQKRTWKAMDMCGNITVATQILTQLADNEPPVLETKLTNKQLTCGENADFDTPIFKDKCGNLTITTEDKQDTPNCANGLLVRTRTWTAKDACGNVNKTSQTITKLADTEAPILEKALTNKQITCGQSASFDTPSFTDKCSQVSVSIEDYELLPTCTDGLHLRTRTWTAKDACGNVTTTSQSITKVADTEAPTLEKAMTDKQIECGATVAFDVPSFKDNCGKVNITYTDDENVSDNCSFVSRRTWKALDACGNETTTAQKIVEVDHTAPIFEASIDEIVLSQAAFAAWSVATPKASDNCSNVSLQTLVRKDDVNCDHANYLHTWLATDNCGNTAKKELLVSISDRRLDATLMLETTNSINAKAPVLVDVKGGKAPYHYDWTIQNQENGRYFSVSKPESTENNIQLSYGYGKAIILVKITDANGCTLEKTASLEGEYDKSPFVLYPNPSSDVATVLFLHEQANDNATLQLYDALGRMLQERKFLTEKGANQLQLQVNDLPSATYFVRLQIGKENKVLKMSKL